MYVSPVIPLLLLELVIEVYDGPYENVNSKFMKKREKIDLLKQKGVEKNREISYKVCMFISNTKRRIRIYHESSSINQSRPL